MMLGFRHKREAYKGMYDRKERMAGRGRMAQELRKALYCIHNLEVEDMEALTGAFAVLSGSGMLDDIIEEAIDTAVSRFVIGEKIGSNVGAVRSHGVVSQATKGNHLFIVF